MKLLTIDMSVRVNLLQERLEALGTLIQSKKPEFVALQNVTNDMLKRINGTTWGALYNIIHPPYTFETRTKPTVAVLSTYPAQDSSTLTYHETATNRGLLKGYYVMYDKLNKPFVICVGTTSLESGLKESEIREKQLNEAFLSSINEEDCFILGNFALDTDIDGELTFDGGWNDAWLCIPGNTISNGDTYDPDKNPLIKDDPFGSGRPDRVFFKSRRYKLDSVEIVGKEPFQQMRGSSVHVSTHYGVLAQFSQLEQLEKSPKQTLVSCMFKRTQWSLQFQQQGQ